MCEGQLINYFYQKHFEITVIKNSFPIIYPLPPRPHPRLDTRGMR